MYACTAYKFQMESGKYTAEVRLSFIVIWRHYYNRGECTLLTVKWNITTAIFIANIVTYIITVAG